MYLKLKDKKEANSLRQFKKVSAELIARCERNHQYNDVEGFCKKILEISTDDQLGYTHLKQILVYENRCQELHELITDRLSHSPGSNFIKLSLVKNIIKGKLTPKYAQAENVLASIDTNNRSTHLSITLLHAKLYGRQKRTDLAEKVLYNYLQDYSTENTTLSKEEVRSIGLAYAKLAITEKKFGKARKILKSFISRQDYANEKTTGQLPVINYISEDHILEGKHKNQVMSLIAKSFLKQGDVTKAKKWYRKILKLNPNNAPIKNCLKKL
ncbi:MAG: tetratricopeptide repeat protein, partial [Cyclobacteriaceae bacterium]